MAPDIKINLEPRRFLEVELKVATPQGSKSARLLVTREVSNPGSVSGDTVSFQQSLPLTQAPGGRWIGRFADDGLLDEDYFGRGVCHWRVTKISACICLDSEQRCEPQGDVKSASNLGARALDIGMAP